MQDGSTIFGRRSGIFVIAASAVNAAICKSPFSMFKSMAAKKLGIMSAFSKNSAAPSTFVHCDMIDIHGINISIPHKKFQAFEGAYPKITLSPMTFQTMIDINV